jgi:hypothetical protein
MAICSHSGTMGHGATRSSWVLNATSIGSLAMAESRHAVVRAGRLPHRR